MELIKRRSIKRYIHTNYKIDSELFITVWSKFWLTVLLIGILTLPYIANEYVLHIASLIGIFTIGAIGLNILCGNTGQISLGHGAFMAIGAYSTAIISTSVSIPFILLIPLAGVITGLIGTIVALPALRLKGLYLAMVTFAFFYIVEFILFNWESLTNGSSGIVVERASIGSWIISGPNQNYWLIMFFTVIATYFAVNMGRSKIGRALGAIRDRDVAAEIIGISLTKYKIQAYFVSSFYAGVAGSLYGIYLGFISPEHFPFMLSIQFLAMILIGGMGTVTGSIFGAVFLVIMPEVLKLITGALRNEYPVLSQQFGDVQTIFYGFIIIITLVFAPKGLYGFWDDIKLYFKKWPFSY